MNLARRIYRTQLQAACIEESVPKRHRLRWTFADEPDRSTNNNKEKTTDNKNPGKTSSRSSSRNSNDSGAKPTNRNLQKELEGATRAGGKRKRRGGGGSTTNASDNDASSRGTRRSSSQRTARRERKSRIPEELSGRERLVCEVIRRIEEDNADVPVGVVTLPSQKRSTFADVRRYIKEDLDTLPVEWAWRFWVPGLGILSTRQESKFGGMLSFLMKTCPAGTVMGKGTASDPVQVVLVEAPKV